MYSAWLRAGPGPTHALMGVLPAPCVAAMQHRLPAALLHLQGPVLGRRCSTWRRSLRPSQRNHWQAGRTPGRSGCEGSCFFPGELCPPCARASTDLSQLCARFGERRHGIPTAQLDRNRFGFGVGMGMVWPLFAVSEQPFPGITEAPLRGPAAHWSRCASLPGVCHITWRQAVWAPGRCGSQGSSPVCGPHFPCMRRARDWSFSASFVPRFAAHHGNTVKFSAVTKMTPDQPEAQGHRHGPSELLQSSSSGDSPYFHRWVSLVRGNQTP